MTQHNNFSPGDACPRILDSALQTAVTDMNLDKRYSDDAIKQRVLELEAEANLLKKLRGES